MLDAKAYGKGFGLDIDVAIIQNLKRIARAVSDGEYDMIGGDVLTARQHHATYLAGSVAGCFNIQIHYAAFKAIFPPERFNGVTHVLDHFHQAESADMRMRCG